MGSFNQVCLLTRAPIVCGDAVVVWEQIQGPWPRALSENSDHGLLFGLPQRACYDDYGGADTYKNEKLFDLHERAWKAQTLYRSHNVNNGHSSRTLSIASSGGTMTSAHLLAPLFYSLEEINPLDVFEQGYEEAFTQKRGRATVRAQEVLKAVGERIGKADLPTNEAQCMALCFSIVQDEVGPHLAWPVWELLSKGELFAQRQLCMMREEAYDHLIATIGQSPVARDKAPSTTYRAHLARQWSAWEEKRQATTTLSPLMASLRLRNDRLMPLSSPWEMDEKPIEAFFWNTIAYDQLLSEVGREVFLDALMFNMGIHYLRVSMQAELGGGQYNDWKLHAGIMKAVHGKVRSEEGALKRDWSPYV